jgi:hypothetical protein
VPVHKHDVEGRVAQGARHNEGVGPERHTAGTAIATKADAEIAEGQV